MTCSISAQSSSKIRGWRLNPVGAAPDLPQADSTSVEKPTRLGRRDSPDPEAPLASARLRGMQAERALLREEGGIWSIQQVVDHLHLSRQAIHKRSRAGTLLAVDIGRRGLAWPAWQFTAAGVLEGLTEVLGALGEHDPWTRFTFFLDRSGLQGERRPLDLLREGRVAEVVRAAGLVGEQIAR